MFGPVLLILAELLSATALVAAAAMVFGAQWGRYLLGSALLTSALAFLLFVTVLGSWSLSDAALVILLATLAALYLLPACNKPPRDQGTAAA